MVRFMPWVAVAVVGLAGLCPAQTPQPATPKHPYEITAEAGPWCICVHKFFENFDQPRSSAELQQMLQSSKARRLAIEFVTVLRRDYKLPAYMFNRGDEERQKEEQRVEEQRKQRWEMYRQLGMSDEDIRKQKFNQKRLAHVQDQYAILIGGFADEEAARRALHDTVRKLELPKGKKEYEEFGERFCDKIRAGQQVRQSEKPDGVWTYSNPFKTAFAAPNPLGPKIKLASADPEELAKGLRAMNEDNPYNLLKHQGKWTLILKIYRIPTAVAGVEDKGVRRASGSNYYEANAKMAEQLAKALRSPQLNHDAYVLHTATASMVTVGVFESERDPRLLQKQAELSKLKLSVQNNTGAALEQLMSTPLPMPVPRVK